MTHRRGIMLQKVLTVAASLLCFLFLTTGDSALAQGAYATANVGYGLSSGTQQLLSNRTQTQTSFSNEAIYGSYGEGLKFGASVGYMFNSNLGTELGFSYWMGKTFEGTNTSTFGTTTTTTTTKLSGTGFAVIPSLVVSANMKKINPYARLGAVIGFLKGKEETTSPGNNERVEEETGGMALGVAGAMGVAFETNSSLSFFAELFVHSVTYPPKQSEVTKLVVNGVDQLPNLTNKVTTYEASTNNTQQNVATAVRRPFSSIGIAVGAKIRI